jgi:DNA-binding transcriptional MerR regulator
MNDRIYTVPELSRELGITQRAIRFYESKGLLEPQRAGNMRVYTKRDRARLKLILRGKTLGFSLKDIQEYLDLYDAEPTQVSQMKLLLEKVDQRITKLVEQQHAIARTLTDLAEIRDQTLDGLAAQGETEFATQHKSDATHDLLRHNAGVAAT